MTMVEYDPQILSRQLEAIRRLESRDQAVIGDILVTYGQMLLEGASRLRQLEELMAKIRSPQS